jgi:hypothetical protein
VSLPRTGWAALAAIGASAVAAAIASSVLIATSLEPLPGGGWFQHLGNERIIEWTGLAAGCAGVVVGSWLGGWRAATLFLAYLVVTVVLAVSGALELARLCADRLGCLADLPVSPDDAIRRQLPSLLGIGAGIALAPLARRMPPLPAYALEAVGACAVILVPLGMLAGVHDPRDGPLAVLASLPAPAGVLTFIALSGVAGLVIAARSRSPMRTTVQLAGLTALFVLPAATSSAMHGGGVAVVAVLATAAGAGLGGRLRTPKPARPA